MTLVWGGAPGRRAEILRDGVPVGSAPSSSRGAVLVVAFDGEEWVLGRSGPDLVARRAEGVGVHHWAYRRGRPDPAWVAECDGVGYELPRVGLMGGTRTILREGERVGDVAASGFRRRRTVLRADTDIPADHQLFLLWLVVTTDGPRPTARL